MVFKTSLLLVIAFSILNESPSFLCSAEKDLLPLSEHATEDPGQSRFKFLTLEALWYAVGQHLGLLSRCRSNADCTPPSLCRRLSSNGVERCRAAGATGAYCDTSFDCGPRLLCGTDGKSKCSSLGWSCADDAECTAPFMCRRLSASSPRKCRRRGGSSALCEHRRDCAGALSCAGGICAGARQAVESSPEPDCAAGDCPTGRVCRRASRFNGTRSCLPRAGLAAFCESSSHCAGAWRCDQGACVRPPSPETTTPPCASDRDCPQPAVCRFDRSDTEPSRVCLQRAPTGAYCDVPAHCASARDDCVRLRCTAPAGGGGGGLSTGAIIGIVFGVLGGLAGCIRAAVSVYRCVRPARPRAEYTPM